MDLLKEILNNSKDAILGGIGGLVAYLYHYAQNREADGVKVSIDWMTFIINGIVGAFVSFCLGDLIPIDVAYRDGIVGMIGVAGFGLMGVIETTIVKIIKNKIKF